MNVQIFIILHIHASLGKKYMNLVNCHAVHKFLYHLKAYYSRPPRASEARARGAPLLRKYGNPSMREMLVL